MKRKIIVGVLCVLVVLGIYYRELLSYGYMQGKGQLDVVWNARPIGEVLADPDFPDSLKHKIQFMQQVREFAIDSLGLKDTDNYTTVYDQRGQDILWNLSACEPFSLQSVEWSFPFLGRFSYKGFFDLDRAKAEQEELKALGYDTRIRTVGAWSTLGWFKDPILSNQLRRGEGALAELVIHELTHATIFVKDSLVYNENLASFIGERGALRFLKSKYGEKSRQLDDYLYSEYDYVRFTDHMLRATRKLDDLYQSFGEDLEVEEKKRKKEAMIRQIVDTIDTLSFKNPKRFEGAFASTLPNNCYFMSFDRYYSKQDLFGEQLERQFAGDIVAFIAYQKKIR